MGVFALTCLFASSESLKDLVTMEVDVKPEIPTPPASDVGSPQSSGTYSHHGSDSEPDSPMVEDSKVAETLMICFSCHAFNELALVMKQLNVLACSG